tara:strand:- start:1132 stop:1341 length:210 start_codon:yes stop_codon:yes gene_type:complete
MTTRKKTTKKTPTKVAPTSTQQLPVVITQQRRNIKELSLFELGLLPFLYLESVVQLVFEYINKKYPLKS